MSSIQVEVAGDYSALLREIARLENVDTEGAMAAIGEGLRESTVRRFDTSTAPDGKKWKTSIRVKEKGGKTLLNRANPRNSIHTEYDATAWQLVLTASMQQRISLEIRTGSSGQRKRSA